MLVVNLILFIVSCLALVKSSSFLVQALSKIANYLKLNEFTVGFLIVAVSTSLPELFIGITSSLEKTPALALGTIIGSNIVDLTLIIGIVAILVRGVHIRSVLIKRDILYMMGIIVLPVLLMIDGELSRLDGGILIGVFVLYVWQMMRQERSFHKTDEVVSHREAIPFVALALVSVVMLIVSSRFVVQFAGLLSIDLVVPPILVGLFVVALGTSLPELMFETHAVLARREELAIGDLLGSVIINSTLVLGVTALLFPIRADFLLFFSSAFFMIVTAFVFMTFAESESGINWKEGVSLLLLYVFFVVIESYMKMLQG